jgi:leucyl/phenylalanyl-tRNA--protein transferase
MHFFDGYYLYLLDDNEIWFPDARFASKDGLVAVGGGLSPEWLLTAYKSGLFPWSGRPVTWWSPDPRAILPFENLHISRSLARFIKKNPFRISIDTAFERVMRECGERRKGGTWITEELIVAYTNLHRTGNAHSLECWLGDDLVGGIYGVSIGGYFSAESMFHRVDNASKVALVELVKRLKERGFQLLDIQMVTPITERMGGITISRDEFLKRLKQAIQKPCSFV